MIPRVEPEGMLFRKPVSTPDRVRGRLFRDHALMPALFVTATGTDIGKTFVTCGLIAELRRQGRAVTALKPVVTGFAADTAAASDPALLLAALGAPLDDIGKISPWRFAAPLSPDLAAQRENRTLDAREVVAFSRTAIA